MKHYTARGSWWSWIPADLLAVAAYAAVAAVATPGATTPLRVAFGLPLVLFAPGYVLLAALYPRRADPGEGGAVGRIGRPTGGRRGLAWAERLPLSLATSLAVVPVLALAVSGVAVGFDADTVVGSLAALVLVGSLVAGLRRLRLPPEERLRVPWRRAADYLDAAGEADRIDAILTAALVLGVLLAATAMAYGVVAPDRGAGYTEFALLSENETGDLVAGGYPASVEVGDAAALTAAVTNHEGGPVEYTVVAELQRVRVDGDEVRVVAQRELTRAAGTVSVGDTWLASRSVEPTMTGEDLRLAYYLYRGDAPADAEADSAYRHLHLWLDVESTNATAALRPPVGVDG